MPGTARASVGGLRFHVLNQGNGRDDVHFKDGDFSAFLQRMANADLRFAAVPAAADADLTGSGFLYRPL